MKHGTLMISCLIVLTVLGCHRDMWDQPKVLPLSESDFFENKMGARDPVKGTIPRGKLQEDSLLSTGRLNGRPSEFFPAAIKQNDLTIGQEKYNIFCSPCHGATGDGLGMIVQRGFQMPSSFHATRLKQAPPGYFIIIMKEGASSETLQLLPDTPSSMLQSRQGAYPNDMVHPVLAKKISAQDLWRIVAYIRALQLSQDATIGDVPEDKLQQLMKNGQAERSE